MEHPGHLIKWIEAIGYMKIKYGIAFILVLMIQQTTLIGQRSYREDSIQFKAYTRLYINKKLGIDSIRIKKIFCEFCTKKQFVALRQVALHMSKEERYNPKYRKPGEHRLALYIRLSKEKFKALNTIE